MTMMVDQERKKKTLGDKEERKEGRRRRKKKENLLEFTFLPLRARAKIRTWLVSLQAVMNSQQNPSRAVHLLVSQATASLLHHGNDIMIKKPCVSGGNGNGREAIPVWLTPLEGST